MIIKRQLLPQLQDAAKQFPVVAILGPRQSGKTTLAQLAFPDHAYITLEDLDMRSLANSDPRGFLNDYPTVSGIILDEIQQAPDLLSYIQGIVDKEKKKGFFILTGSQNLLLNEAISQTLAGRIALLTLLPLSIHELEQASLLPESVEELTFNGSYPRIYADGASPNRLYQGYLRTYIERDVRQLQHVLDLGGFEQFITICATRAGQQLNYTALSNDCGIDEKTVKRWLGLLEASYVIFFLRPYFKNFGKRLVKAPKLYFVDTGLACTLLRIKSVEELVNHSMRGPLVENLIMVDLLKQQYNLERLPSLYFWRDQSGHEVDCIVEEVQPVAIEIKASKTVIPQFFKGLSYWNELAQQKKGYIIYGGAENQSWPDGSIISWRAMGDFIKKNT